MKFGKVTAVLVVQEVEPCIEFWSKRLGFETRATVPEGDKLGFAILGRDGVEIMYQSIASVAKDNPAILAGGKALRSVLYFDVDDLDAVERKLDGVKPLFARRKTFYGADEVCVADPAGNVVTFSTHSDA